MTGIPTLRLKVSEGNAAGTDILVEGELVIGRQADGPGGLGNDSEISRRHARIFKAESGFAIEDLGSTNGTIVNGEAIQQPVGVVDGDVIEVGGTRLVVQVSDVPTPVESPPVAGDTLVPAPTPELESEPPAEPAATVENPRVPPIGLRIEVDLEAGEARLQLDGDADTVRLALDEGRWAIEPAD